MWKTYTFGDRSAGSKNSSLREHENQPLGPENHGLCWTHKVAISPELSHVGEWPPNRILGAPTQLVWMVLDIQV